MQIGNRSKLSNGIVFNECLAVYTQSRRQVHRQLQSTSLWRLHSGTSTTVDRHIRPRYTSTEIHHEVSHDTVYWVPCSCHFTVNPSEPGGNYSATSNNMKLVHSPPRPLLAVPNATAHPPTASVPITVLLCNGPLFCCFNVGIKGLNCSSILQINVCSGTKLKLETSPNFDKLSNVIDSQRAELQK